MINRTIKNSFDQAKLSETEKEELYQRILTEASSSRQTVVNLERKKTMKKLVIGAACLAAVCIVPAGTYAAYKCMSPKQVATEIEDKKLAETFGKAESEAVVKESGEYQVAYLGSVSGKQIGSSIEVDGEIKEDRTYLVVAIERKDGTPMTLTDPVYISPFVQNLNPAKYNIHSMNGSSAGAVKDGVLYRVIECDELEKFANRNVYLAVQDGLQYKDAAYIYDEQDGTITRNERYQGMNVLFSVSLDTSKAVSDAVNRFIKDFEEHKKAEEPTDVATQKSPQIDREKQQIKKNNITYSLIPANRFAGASDTKSFYGLYAEIKGGNIETITYTLDKDVFYKKTEATEEEAANYDETKYEGSISKEMIDGKTPGDVADQVMGDKSKREWLLSKAGNSYTVAYDKQNTVGNFYAIGVTAKNVTEGAGRETVYETLADALKENVVHVTVTFKDGHKETNDIVFVRNDTTIVSKMITAQWK
ncbi:MAG: hypothetical protein Q4F05_03330 [bacterium]|nr:hypothetical protein [bacterium]